MGLLKRTEFFFLHRIIYQRVRNKTVLILFFFLFNNQSSESNWHRILTSNCALIRTKVYLNVVVLFLNELVKSYNKHNEGKTVAMLLNLEIPSSKHSVYTYVISICLQ